MSSEAKLVWRATALGISAFTSGYFARMMDDGKGNVATVGFIFALCVAVFVVMMMIFDAE
jgi:hypothetical protein